MPLNFRPRGEARYDHQKRVLRRIIETRGVCALLCDPGTGKTACVVDYASALALKTERPIRVLVLAPLVALDRSEEHTSELQSLMRISYAVFCLKKKKNNKNKSQ